MHQFMPDISAITGPPKLYGPDNRLLKPSSAYTYRRDAARRTGSLKNWNPRTVYGKQAEALERLDVVERSVDLSYNDPHAAGVIDSFATTVVGAGLVPHPTLDNDVLSLSKDEIRELQSAQRAAWQSWIPFADAGARMDFGQLQYLAKTCMLRYGEYFVLLPMIDDPDRPYSLACQVINPLRVKTPVDMLTNSDIRDGIELGEYGQAEAVWIKKTSNSIMQLPDISENFMRICVKRGHRRNVLHGFVCKDPDQVRGWPFFAPAMKYFRDFNDLLNAELVSNVVTAALSYFIEVSGGADPYGVADNFMTNHQSTDRSDRYEDVYPGQIMYGSAGEKPHLLSAQRPGTTFEPFTKTIKKSIAMALNIPYPVLFKDVEGVNFAGFRSAMLDAWRVFLMERSWHGSGFCQPVYTMLQEEAYLRGNLPINNFYDHPFAYTLSEWRGAPKGDIEPIKARKADILAISAGLKTRTAVIVEQGGGSFRSVMDTLEEEQEIIREKGLNLQTDISLNDTEDPDDTEELDDDDERTNINEN